MTTVVIVVLVLLLLLVLAPIIAYMVMKLGTLGHLRAKRLEEERHEHNGFHTEQE